MADDIIQETVNKETEEAIKRYQRHINYHRDRYREKLNKNRKHRKMERINRKQGRKNKWKFKQYIQES